MKTCAELVVAALFVCASFLERSAHAQDPTATALFRAGKDLASQGNYKDACPKFEASYKHEAVLGTLMNMADCHEKVGAIARAWSEWGAAYDSARKAGDSPRADLSKRRQDALEPRVPKLKVSVKGSAPDLAVWRDDRALDSLEYDVELPIETGKHVISVKRGNTILESQERIAEESAHLTMSFDIATIAAAHPPPPDAPKEKPLDVHTPGQTKKKGWPDTVGPIVIAVGALTTLVGIGLEIAAIGLKNNNDCTKEGALPTLCTESGLDKIQTARSAAIAGGVSLIAGPAIAAGGLGIYLFGPRSTVSVAVIPVPNGATTTWGMRF